MSSRQRIVFLALAAHLCCLHVLTYGATTARYTFDAPDRVEVVPGGRAQFSVAAQIAFATTAAADRGPAAWSMGLEVTGGDILEILPRYVLPDVPGALPGQSADFVFHEIVGAGRGVVHAAVLDFENDVSLDPAAGPHAAMTLVVEGRLISNHPCATVELRFVDGLRGAGQTVDNLTTIARQAVRPQLGATGVTLAPPADWPEVTLTLSERFPSRSEAFVLLDNVCGLQATARIETLPGKPVLVTLDDAETRNEHELFVRWGAPPTERVFDLAATTPAAQQRLVVPGRGDDVLYVLAVARTLHSSRERMTLGAQLADLQLERVSPTRAATGRPLRVSLFGGGFRPGDLAVELVHSPSGAVIPASQSEVIALHRAEATFDLTSVATGLYDVLARVPDAEEIVARLPDALEILEPDRLFGLDVDLVLDSVYTFSLESSLWVEYENITLEPMVAPLFKVVAPEGVSLRLVGEGELVFGAQGDNELLFLGVDPEGDVGTLAAGASHTRRIRFVGSRPVPLGRFRVEILGRDDIVDWASIARPDGIDVQEWKIVTDWLDEQAGTTWRGIHEHMGALATRLAHRGVDGGSTTNVLRFAVRQALGLPHSAITGRALHPTTFAPLEGSTVLAIQGGCVRSRSPVNAAGAFALVGLAPGPVEVRVEGATEGSRLVQVPLVGDLRDVDLLARPGAAGVPADCTEAAPMGLAAAPIDPPAALFAEIEGAVTNLVGAIDPNDKEGPPGEDNLHVIGRNHRLSFTISFLNDPDEGATTPAKTVEIVDDLQYVMSSTVRLHSFYFDGLAKEVSLDRDLGPDLYNGSLSLSGLPEAGSRPLLVAVETINVGGELVTVHVSAQFVDAPLELPLGLEPDFPVDPRNRQLRWLFESFDGDVPIRDPNRGFLPVGGEGYVKFDIALDPDVALEEGQELNQRAFIFFDNVPLETKPAWRRPFSELMIAPAPDPASAFVLPDGSGVQLLWKESHNAAHYDVTLWPADGTPETGTTTRVPGFVNGYFAGSLPAETPHHWRVVALNSENTLMGDEGAFTTVDRCPEPPGELAVDVSGGCAALVFFWQHASRATSYQLLLETDEAGLRIEQDAITGTSVRVERDLSELVRWQVVAFNEECPEGVASTIQEDVEDCDLGPLFIRGDCDGVTAGGSRINLTDAVVLLNFAFLGGPKPPCLAACNVDGEGDALATPTDPVYLLNFLFLGGPPPPAPHPGCGPGNGTTDRVLGCESAPEMCN